MHSIFADFNPFSAALLVRAEEVLEWGEMLGQQKRSV